MLLFGTAGITAQAKEQSTEGGIKRAKEIELGCMEIEFVQGVRMGEEKAKKVRETALSEGIGLTVHAPYFINLSSKEPEKVKASIQRILDSARIGAMAGARSVTFHPAYYGEKSAQEVYKDVKNALLDITSILRSENIKIYIRPETTGKPSQFGTLEEIVLLSQEVSGILPCVDFSHLYARSGGKRNSYDEFIKILELIEKELGSPRPSPQSGNTALQNMHIHTSGIAYGLKGEKHHTIFEESEFNYKALLKALKDKKAGGFLICESPNPGLEDDALLLKKIYNALH